MKKLNKLVAFVFIGLAFACGNPEQHEHTETTASNETEKAVTDEQAPGHDQSEGLTLSLNNGAKWAADESTFTGMKRLELTLYDFKEKNAHPAIEDYNKLGTALANINAEIIKQCSMQGKDHDQLHLLLEPMLQNVDAIKNGNDTGAAAENLLALEKSIAMFFTHFALK